MHVSSTASRAMTEMNRIEQEECADLVKVCVIGSTKCTAYRTLSHRVRVSSACA
jgi:hypothetical protein